MTSGTTPAPDRAHVPLWLLAVLTFSATLAMHVFVPALPLAGRDLGASAGAMQMTVSVYVVGLALGQLVHGPLSDRFGRRPVLMAGLALYAVSGLAATLAPGVGALIAARLFQAFGGCAGMVLGRAIVRDTAGPQEAARRLALMNLMVTLGPGFAPIIGGAVAYAAGWRWVLALMGAFGIAGLVMTWRILPETGSRAGVSAAALARDYARLLRSPAFLGYALGGACATTAMYAFIASAPFIIMDQLHRPPGDVGIVLAILVSGIWLGSVVVSRLVSRVAADRIILPAGLFSVVGAFLLLAATLSQQLTLVTLVAPLLLFTFGAGVAAPAALSQALSVNPKIAGSASGLYGFTQMAVGAVCTALAGVGEDKALSAALIIAVAAVVGQASFRLALRLKRTA